MLGGQMAGADYTLGAEVFNRDETFEYTVSWKWEEDDGSLTAFSWSDYTLDYWLSDECGSSRLTLSAGDGITVDQSEDWVTFSAAMPAPGRYTARCRATHNTTGKSRVVFEHPVIIAEDNT